MSITVFYISKKNFRTEDICGLGHQRLVAWLNPVPDDHWDYTSSLCIIRELVDNRMFPLTLKGLEEGMSELSK